MAKRKFKNRKTSPHNSRKTRALEDKSPKRAPFIVFSFKDFDRNQGQSFKEWEKEEILALACEKLISLSQYTVAQALQQQIIKIYGNFPPKSNFSHPRHVPEDVKWASFRIQGKERIIGYFSDEEDDDDNVFYIVFLDKDHRFWITEKKNT